MLRVTQPLSRVGNYTRPFCHVSKYRHVRSLYQGAQSFWKADTRAGDSYETFISPCTSPDVSIYGCKACSFSQFLPQRVSAESRSISERTVSAGTVFLFIAVPSAAGLSHRQTTSAGRCRHSCDAQNSVERNAL